MRTAILAVLSAPFCCLVSSPQSSVPSASPPVSFQDEAVVVEQSDTTFLYNADGTGDKSLHVRVRVQSEAGARQFSVLSFPYASANDTPTLESLVVHHPGHTDTETPPADAIDMPAPVTQQAPLYSDLKILQIPVRGLAAGDTIEYRVNLHRKSSESPNQFWDNLSFLKGVVALAESVTLDVPEGKRVQTWSPAIKPVVSITGGRRVYTWSSSQLQPTSSDAKKDQATGSQPANKPDVAWTTFQSWQEVGDWYRALSAPRAAVTDALRAKADELTRDAKSPEEQVQALYAFVSTHIRYVGIDFGIGRFQPHLASEVLANQYGDCKDKDTLLEALLHAKGFASGPALIGAGLDMISDVPSPAFFNHVITTVDLPTGRLWIDTTPEVAPFRLLIQPLRDKEALVIPPSGAAKLEHTPAQPPFPFTDHFEATAMLKPDGELTGHVNIDFRSDSEIVFRAIARALAPAQWDQGSQYIANLLGFSGTTSNSSLAHADDTAQPFRISYDYTRKPFGDWDNFRIVPLFPINFLPAVPEKEPSGLIDLGAVRTESASSRIRLPEGYLADLPDAIHVQTPFATFDKTYRLESGELIAEKKLVVLQSNLPAASWEQYKKFAKDISLGEESWVQLTSTNPQAKGPHPPKPGENNFEAARLVSEALVLERNSDWDGTLKKLDEAKKLQPEQAFLWSNYGYVAMRQNKADEAKEDFRRELKNHPDEGYVVQLYGGFLFRRGEFDEARSVLQNYFDRDPSDGTVARLLASVELRTSLEDAIATLRRSAASTPGDHWTQSMLGEVLIQNHQPQEAAGVAKKLLADYPDDPDVLNSAAYMLAETDTDLPIAEEKSKRSLDLLEGETAKTSINEANLGSSARILTLIASWDTLGYIYLKEKKLDDARDYLEAAWKNRNDPVVGLHYAQVLEALGDRKDALRVDELAHGFRRAATASRPPELDEIEASIARLKAAGVPSTLNISASTSVELISQQERTFKIKITPPAKAYTSGVFRLQFTATSISGLLQVNGESFPDSAQDAIRKIDFPHLVPAHSQGRIFRDAVLTCSRGETDCFLVLMPLGSLAAEQNGN